MTDQELKEMLADLIATQKGTDLILNGYAKRAEEDRRKIEADLAEERRKTEKVVRQVNKQLGELRNKFGSFTEGMALPSMEKILYQQFKMDIVNPRAEVLNKGLYLARIHDGEFELLTPRGFKPAPFGPTAKQNGKVKKRPSAKK
ncbi:MAG: hypothetical protein ACREA2_20550 [Blastocatellia bacterium]